MNLAVAIGKHHGYANEKNELGRYNENKNEVVKLVGEKGFAADELARKSLIGLFDKIYPNTQGKLRSAIFGESDTVDEFHTLAGLCSVADWLASEYHKFLPQGDPSLRDLPGYYTRAKEELGEFIPKRVGRRMPAVYGIGDILQATVGPEAKPKGLQEDLDKWPTAGGLYVLEASTGSGKTECALAQAIRLVREGLADNIIFALPTQASTNAMFRRIRKIAPRLSENTPVSLSDESFSTLAHGKASLVEERAGEQWFNNNKKAMFAPICVCTVDQILLSVLKGSKFSFVRWYALARSVIIIDEVHSYDAYMNFLLDKIIEYHVLAGGTVILMSATLPSSRINEQIKLCRSDAVPPTNYPSCLHLSPSTPMSWTAPARIDKTKSILIRCRNLLSYENSLQVPSEVLSECQDRIDSGQLVGFFANFVDHARIIAEQFTNADLIHSRYIQKDRIAKESKILLAYGRKNRKGRILIATQVAEESLDIDVDFLVTFWCPIDKLLQRIGRLQRFDLPGRSIRPECLVLVPDEEELGDDAKTYSKHGYVYGNVRVLYATEQLIREYNGKYLQLPADYRRLVDSAYRAQMQLPEQLETMQEEYELYVEDAKALAQARANSSTPSSSSWTRDDIDTSRILLYSRNEDGTPITLDGRRFRNKRDPDLYSINVPDPWLRYMTRSNVLIEPRNGTITERRQDDPTPSNSYLATGLPMLQQGEQWVNGRFTYTKRFGLTNESSYR